MRDKSSSSSGFNEARAWALLRCCTAPRVGAAEAERASRLIEEGLDWDHVRRLAAGHRVTALLHEGLKVLPPSAIPPDVRDALAADSLDHAARGLRLSAQLIEVLDTLRSRGIPVLTFKGPVLAMQAYGSVACRWSNDLDILVRRADLPAVEEAMGRLGYALPERYGRLLRGVHPRAEYHYAFFPREGHGRVVVEAHAEPFMWYFAVDWDADELLRHAVTEQLVGARVPTLAPEDLVLFLAVHGAAHAWRRLELVVSFAAIVDRHPDLDWDGIVRRARDLGAVRMVCVAARLADGVSGVAVAAPVALAAAGDPGAAALAGRLSARLHGEWSPMPRPLTRLGTHLRLRERWRDRATYGWRSAATQAVILASRIGL